MSERLWAITSYFNPARYQRRLVNYRVFRRHLAVPLVAVELGSDRRFELGRDDADVLVQLAGRDPLWQKERLLNLALAALPAECTQVVWLDCDVLFANTAWPAQLSAALERFALVRPYTTPLNHGPAFRPAAGDFAPLSGAARPLPLEPTAILDHVPSCRQRPLPAKPWGRAYAASRALLADHGLYDACIIGGGDLAIALAACGLAEQAADALALTPPHRAHYLAWAGPFHAAVSGNVGRLDGALHHLWHGRRDDRRYGERHIDLAAHAFDPTRDLVRSSDGAWQWSGDKPALAALVADYFAARREDG
jgi:hypothetical protein